MLMKLKLPYGEKFLEVELPEDTAILRSAEAPAVKNVVEKISGKLKSYRGFVNQSRRILILIPDNTRAFPTRIVLPATLNFIEEFNPEARIRILIATGLHKPVSRDEVKKLVGEEIFHSYEIANHSAFDGDQIFRSGEKTSFGTPIEVNKLVYESDLVIGLGLIEPHFFAGYSGGRKIILPGIAGENAIFSNHGFRMIANPRARTGILEGNPVHEDMVEFVRKTRLDLIVNVTLNRRKEVTGVFVGDPVQAHLDGVRYLDKFVKVNFGREADIVITTNGGYPLDRDVYQAVKGMDTATSVVRDGGVIIIASECRDGLGGHEELLKLTTGAGGPDDILGRIRENEPVYDQWQAQILARALRRAKIILISEHISERTAKNLLLERAKDVEEALEMAYSLLGRRRARIAVIPEGPYVIPVKGRAS